MKNRSGIVIREFGLRLEGGVMTEQTTSLEVILNLYADGPAKLEAALAGLSEPDLDLALTSDSWTIRQIVHHIADGDDL